MCVCVYIYRKTGLCLTPNTSHACLKLTEDSYWGVHRPFESNKYLSGRSVEFFFDFAHGAVNEVILEER